LCHKLARGFLGAILRRSTKSDTDSFPENEYQKRRIMELCAMEIESQRFEQLFRMIVAG
jgi:hypothetical protein